MSSINNNLAASTALMVLQSTNKELLGVQNRISTGMKVSSAEDNAAYWSIATTMRSDSKALATVNDALSLGASTVDVAYTAMNKAIDITGEIKNKLVASRTPGVDRSKIQTEITQLQSQLTSVASQAGFNGQNWLSVDSSASGYNANKDIVASYNRSASGVISVGTITISVTSLTLFDASASATGIIDGSRDSTGAVSASGTFTLSSFTISSLTDSSTDLATIDGYIKGADAAMKSMTDAASTLGSVKQRVSMQQDFMTALKASVDKGVSSLVDADMNEESTRLAALQVKQQLGVQSLSIANSSSQSILSLFRG
jgi:flagellin